MKTISNNLLKSFKKAPLNNVVFILFLLASIFLTRTLLGFLGWRNDFTLVALLFVAIINTEKYKSFSATDRERFERIQENFADFKITDVKIKTPDNPSILKQAKLITLCR